MRIKVNGGRRAIALVFTLAIPRPKKKTAYLFDNNEIQVLPAERRTHKRIAKAATTTARSRALLSGIP